MIAFDNRSDTVFALSVAHSCRWNSTARTQHYAHTFLGNGWIQENDGENQLVGYNPADRAISVRGLRCPF